MRQGRGLLLGALFILIGAGAAVASVHPIELAAEESRITVLSQTGDELRFRVEVGELSGMDVETPEGTFTRLLIPGFFTSKAVGAPEIPMINRLLEIPSGAEARVEVVSVESRTIRLEEYGITHRLMPAQPSLSKADDPATVPFLYDEATYDVDRVAQDLVSLQDFGMMRAVRIGRVDVSPVEYFPRRGEIVVHESIELRVVFDHADLAAGEALKARLWSPFFEPVYEQLAGYQQTRSPHDTHPDLVRDLVTYVIVTPSSYVSTLQPFIDWKTERGFVVVVGEIGSPEVGTTTTSIEAYINGLYNNPTPERPAPSFLLIAGDVEQVPTYSTSNGASDRNYGDVTGDLAPEIYYGRFPAATITQLQNMVDKTLMYEQYTMPDPAYLGEVVMIAGYDGSFGQVWANGQINYGTTHYFNEAHGIFSHTHLYPQSGSDDAIIVQEVSDGCGYVNYTAHGSQTSWSDPSFTQANVRSLQNNGEYCLAVGNCCLAASYNIAECFAETWLREANKGAIGYIGGSNNTYWDEDYWWGVGYGTVVQFPVYENFGLGAYDGIFHDHGEPMDNWYVTNDAIIFCGNLAVMESGSSRITYYWDIYNLSGDPSLSTYLGVPDENPVVHPTTLFTTSPSVAIDAAPGSYCGLTQDGVIVGAGTVAADGTLDLTLWDVLTPGTAHLVVGMQFKEPYVADIPVIVPATIWINPDTITADVETQIEVTVLEADGVTPKPGIDVWADGLGYLTTPVTTNAAGICTLTVDYPYGPSLDIVGKDPSVTYTLFRESIVVLAADLTTPDLWVTTTIGLADTFALNLPGVLHMSVGGHPTTSLWAILPDGSEIQTADVALEVTPTEEGAVTGAIAVAGYNLYSETFPIIEAFGTLTGHVDAAGSPGAGAVVEGYDMSMAAAWDATANASGNYDVGEDILVAPYIVNVDYFGYLHYADTIFVNYGANVYDITLTQAPSGILTGTVTDQTTGEPLEATVKVYRSDTMGLYTQTVSDSATGVYTTAALPYFDWVVVVKAFHHRALTIDVTIEEPVVEKDFVLEATVGDILVLNDGAKGTLNAPKIDDKTGAVIEDGYVGDDGKAAADIVADLEAVGYSVTLETATSSDPGTWGNYDVLILTSGANTSPIASATLRSSIESFVIAGGHILVEGGEVGYDAASSPGYPTFATNVLHSNDWNHDQSGNLTVADATHYVMSVPNLITGPVTMTYAGYGDQDAMVPNAGADRVASWTTYPTDASIIVFDSNPAPEGGQIVFFCFNYSAMDAAVRPLLLENAVNWLLTPEFGDCSVSGTAVLAGQSDHSGIKVSAIPSGGFVYTGPTGAFDLTGLYAGTYMVIASKEGWAIDGVEVSLSPGGHVGDIDLRLTPPVTDTLCENPNRAIPDYPAPGIYDTCNVISKASIVTDIEVFVDILHTYQGDLVVDLASPNGTNVILHNRTGGTTDNIYGWYPTQLTPAGDLNDFVARPVGGMWIIHVVDQAGSDIGSLRSWCLALTHGREIDTGVESGKPGVPRVLALNGNQPNPFNPETTILFDLPSATDIRLSVYEPSGRKVATLLSGHMEAGSYHVRWMGIDDDGNPAGSGVYFYRLEAGEKMLTGKMVLLR
jgi:subtilisin-like proprotein convertase family protein